MDTTNGASVLPCLRGDLTVIVGLREKALLTTLSATESHKPAY